MGAGALTPQTVRSVSTIEVHVDIGNKLRGVAFIKESLMAITDSERGVLLVRSKQGVVLESSSDVLDPHGIAYNPKQDCLVVCERHVCCLCLLNPNTLALINKLQLHQFSPCNIAMMSNGNIALTDPTNRRVGVFDMDGAQVYSWAPYINGFDRLSEPSCIAVDINNNIYVGISHYYTEIVELNQKENSMHHWDTRACPCGVAVYGKQVLVAERRSVPDVEGVSVYRVGGGEGRDLIPWDTDYHGCIMVIVQHQEQLAVLGHKGLVVYSIT